MSYPDEEWQANYMRQLEAQILEWKLAYYYGEGDKTDDQTYDLWWRNLLSLEAKYPHLKSPESPTINPGAPVPTEKVSK